MKMKIIRSLFGVAVVKASENSESKSEQTLIKRTNLPVYSEATSSAKEKNVLFENPVIMNVIKRLRIEGCKIARTAQTMSERCSEFISVGIAHSEANFGNVVEYLQAEKNLLPRISAIGGGFLVGYVIGLRRGFFRRIVYASIGGLTIATMCYPKEAEEYFQQSRKMSRRYLMIGYHFVNGVSKDFIGVELPKLLPKQDNTETFTKDDSK